MERTRGHALHVLTESLHRERDGLKSDLSVKEDALRVGQQATDRAVVNQNWLAATSKEEIKKHNGEQKALRKKKLAVDTKLQAQKDKVKSMGKQISKLNEELRAAKVVRLFRCNSFYYRLQN